MRSPDAIAPRRRPSPWAWLVTGSAVVVLGCGLALGVWWLATSETQIATYSVTGAVNRVTLDLAGANATVLGGGSGRAVEVRRTDEFSFGRRAESRRAVAGGELRLRSRCPATVLASCSASYQVRVPDNIPVTVKTSSGDVRFSAYRGLGEHRHDDRRHLGRRLLRLPAERAGRERQRAGEHVVLAGAARAAVALGRTSAPSSRPGATASTPTRTPARGASWG